MIIEPPPSDIAPNLRDYLLRMFKQVDSDIRRDPILNPSDRVTPAYSKPGMLMYFTKAVPGTTITAEGLYFHDSTTWIKLS